jgi:hypothetical protein
MAAPRHRTAAFANVWWPRQKLLNESFAQVRASWCISKFSTPASIHELGTLAPGKRSYGRGIVGCAQEMFGKLPRLPLRLIYSLWCRKFVGSSNLRI